MLKSKKGFTLIELLIVVAIIGILAAIAIPAFSSYRAKSYNTAAVADIRNLKTGMEAYQADTQSYPTVMDFCPQATACTPYASNGTLQGFAATNEGVVVVAPNNPATSATVTTAAANAIDPADQSIGKTSTGVQPAIWFNDLGTVYQLQTQHVMGTRMIGTAYDTQAIYYQPLVDKPGTLNGVALTGVSNTDFDTANTTWVAM